MRRTASLCVAATLSGIAAAYILNQWVLPWWLAPPPEDSDEPELSPDTPPASHEATTSSASLHTLSSEESMNTSDADTEPFVDVLSPPPSDAAISRRRSFRSHDLFAASHISFSELGSLVAPENGHQ